MEQQELGERIIALTPTLFHVSFGLLRNEADREDAVQSAIEKAWAKASRLREPNKLKPWLIRILINECYSILRKKSHEILSDVLPESETCDGMKDTTLQDAILQLPDDVRIPIMLHYMEGFSIKEIASTLRCPQGTVLSRMNRGRKQLRDFLTEVEV